MQRHRYAVLPIFLYASAGRHLMNCQELPKSRPWRNSGPNYAIPSSAPSSSEGILIKDPRKGGNRHQLKRKLINIRRGEGGGAGKGKKDTGYLYKALLLSSWLSA